MSGFFGKLKNTGVKAKLQGECAMLDREIKARKTKFGVELYDLIRKQEKEAPVKNMADIQGSFKSRIKEQWDKVREDIRQLEDKKAAFEVERTHEEVRRERGAPAVSVEERMAKAGSFVSSTGKETKLMAQIAMVDRDIKRRKEQFGIDVFEDAAAAMEKGGGGTREGGGTTKGGGFKSGIKSAIGKGLQRVSPHEKNILHCVEMAVRDVESSTRSKNIRLREIDEIEEQGGSISFGRKNDNRAEV